ncbi:MAG: ATP-binding protein [Acidobacteriota bacterium]
MRLFWRILSGYFLAWTLLSLALFGALALDLVTHYLPRTAVSEAIPSMVGVQIAATNLRHGGEDVFRKFSADWLRGEPPWVVDGTGREVLGREVDPAILELARSLAVETVEPSPVKRITSPDGRAYVVYFPEGKGPEDRTPLGWFFDWPWLIGVVFAAAGLLLAGGLTAAWTRPIAALKAAFDSFASGRLEPQIDPSVTQRRDEIGDLGRHFEKMARRLARSIEAQRQLLHDISHELRSPLARLSVASELARRRPERIEEALERIDRESQRLDRLIGEVLTLARLESDVDEPLEDYFDLLELLRVIRDDVAFEAYGVGVEIALEIPEREELVMRGSAELLHRAIENVVRNALQHAGSSGRIEMVLEEPRADRIILRVRDHGEGIAAEELESLFEPFQRGRESTGFGLGLAIARRAVAVHHGTISARSEPGTGVEVEIRLPLQVAA